VTGARRTRTGFLPLLSLEVAACSSGALPPAEGGGASDR